MWSLFVYGTLQHPPLLDQLLGRRPMLVAATVEGWRAAPLRDAVYPGLVPAPGDRVPGRLLDVDDGELAVLDRFEGSNYERVAVIATPTVTAMPTEPPTRTPMPNATEPERIDAAGAVEAQAWRLRDEHLDLALAGAWDLDHFLAVDADRWLGRSRPGRRHP